jgi:hypothetical protein
MLQLSLTRFLGIPMKMTRFATALALVTAATACTAERALSPQPAAPSTGSALMAPVPQVPLLFVVDGVKYQRDQIPSLTADQISAVEVIKGSAALRQYGPEASYGVVVITTKQAAAPRT